MTPSSERAGGRTPAGRHAARSIMARLTGIDALLHPADRANVEQLRVKLGCSLDDARRVYALAREQGFGAACESVFGAARPMSRSRNVPGPLPGGSRPMRRISSQHGRRPQTP